MDSTSHNRIEHAGLFPWRAPLRQPFRIATGEHRTLDNILFVITLADGTKGFGEAAVAQHITGETWDGTWRSLDRIGRFLAGKSTADYMSLSAWFNGQFPDNKAAVAAAETALMDALCRQWNIPLWQFFGPRPERLRTDITVVIGSLEEARTAVRRYRQKGFRSFKVKVGKDFDLDIKRVAAVKKGAARCEIILDVNQGFSVGDAIRFLHQLKRLGVRPSLIEQPAVRDDLEGLKRVRHLTKVPVCADESAASLTDCLKIIRSGCADVINIKLMKFGLFHAREAAVLVRNRGLGLMIGAMMESILATTASAHLASGLGGFRFIDLDTAFFVKGGLAGQKVLSESGVYDIPRVKKGTGIIPKT